MTVQEEVNAYREGHAAGKADRGTTTRSDYAWHGVSCDSPATWSYHYSRGYREGWTWPNGRTL